MELSVSRFQAMQRYCDAKDSRFEVLIDDAALRSMVNSCSFAGSMETGGILIGSLSGEGRLAVICEATSKPADSAAGWAWFKRGSEGLQTLLARKWDRGLHYLGEWHFHPGGGCQPSDPDKLAMTKIASDGRYDCREPILVILGGKMPNNYKLSVSVFPRDETPIFLAEKLNAAP